ncbi:MAG: hypothetical protein LBB38_00235, partial [Puniceicoccales bacterium]|nr:hypothetical protein [Puniceicoccales bacterium]
MRISGTDPNSYGYLLPPLSAAVKEIYGGGASNPELLIASSTEKHRVSFSLARICLKYSGVGGFLAILKAALYCTFGCSAADDPILRAMIELNAAENARVLAANRKIATDAMSLAATIEAASGNFTGIDGLFTHLQTSPLLTLTRNDINGIRKFFERIPNDEFPSFLQHSEPAKDESALITLTLS